MFWMSHTLTSNRCICMSGIFCEDSTFVFRGNSCFTDIFLVPFMLVPSTQFVLCFFHACAPLVQPHLHQPPSPPIVYPFVLAQCKSRTFSSMAWYLWMPSNTHIHVSSSHDCHGHTVNIMLSGPVRHAGSLLLVIWKLCVKALVSWLSSWLLLC